MRHTTFGVMLVILGAILLLGVIVQDISLVLRFWPLLVVVYALLAHGLSPAYRGGLIVVALVLLADALAPSILGLSHTGFWAPVLIVVGLLIIFSATEHDPREKRVKVKTGASAQEVKNVKYAVRDETADGTSKAGAASSEPGGVEMTDETKRPESEAREESAAAAVEGEYRDRSAHFLADVPEGAERLICDLDFNAGKLELAGDTDKLFEIDTGPGSDVEPQVDVSLEETDGVKVARLKIEQAHFKSSVRMFGVRTVWTLKLNGELPLTMNCDVNAAKANLDFSKLRLTSLAMGNNAAASEVRIGSRENEATLRIDNNAAKFDLVLPADFAYEATVDSNVGRHNVTDLLPRRVNDHYYSEDFDSNPRKVRMHLENNAAKLNIRRR
ncbi:hypothetical protein J7J84_02330 [bacterium]|nr:hypothetical protein [bacterium]